jgi:hypothetical protein
VLASRLRRIDSEQAWYAVFYGPFAVGPVVAVVAALLTGSATATRLCSTATAIAWFLLGRQLWIRMYGSG